MRVVEHNIIPLMIKQLRYSWIVTYHTYSNGQMMRTLLFSAASKTSMPSFSSLVSSWPMGLAISSREETESENVIRWIICN